MRNSILSWDNKTVLADCSSPTPSSTWTYLTTATQLLERRSKFGISGRLASINAGASCKVRELWLSVSEKLIGADVLDQLAKDDGDQWMIEEERRNLSLCIIS